MTSAVAASLSINMAEKKRILVVDDEPQITACFADVSHRQRL